MAPGTCWFHPTALQPHPVRGASNVEGRYLVEDVSISYVTSGRDLVRMLVPRPPASRPILFADPAFDVGGALLASVSAHDVSGGLVLSISTPNIHSIRLTQTLSDIAHDDLRFNYSLDLRGTSETDKREGAYTMELLADDIAAFMHAAGLQRSPIPSASRTNPHRTKVRLNLAYASSTSVSPRSSAATIVGSSTSKRRINSARRVLPIRTHTTEGPGFRMRCTPKSSSLVTITAPDFAAVARM